jgi:hypothetical protein
MVAASKMITAVALLATGNDAVRLDDEPEVAQKDPASQISDTAQDIVKAHQDPCKCQSSWEYKGETYEGCAKTPDWDESWCYVVGGKGCATSEDSLIAGEERRARKCAVTKQQQVQQQEQQEQQQQKQQQQQQQQQQM